MASDTENVWKYIEHRIYLDPFAHHVRHLQLTKILDTKIH